MILRPNVRRLLVVAGSALGALALLVLGAAALVPALVPADDLRRAAAHAISGGGADVSLPLSNEPSLSLLPTPRLVLGKMAFAVGDRASLDTERVVARLRLLPLLVGRVEISDITLVRPTLVMRGAQTLAPYAHAALLRRPEMPALRILDGTIAWRTAEGLTEELVSGIIGSLDRQSGGKGLVMATDFSWRDQRVQSRLAIADIADFLDGTPTDTRCSLAIDGAKARYRGLAAFDTMLAATGELEADAVSLRSVMELVGIRPPTAGGFGRLDFSSKLKAEAGELAFTDTAVELDGNRAEGGVAVKVENGRPSLQGTFASEVLDIVPYGRVSLTGPNGRSWDTHHIDLSRLAQMDADLRLSAAKVKTEESAFGSVATSAVLSGGRLVLAIGQANGWGGRLRASLTLTPQETARSGRPGAAMRLEAEGTNVALEPALLDLAGIHRLSGTGDLQLAIEGQGDSIDAIARTLDGTLVLSGTDGTLLGIDALQVLKRLERRPLSGGTESRGGRTAYDKVKGKMTIAKGSATVETFALEGRQVRVAMDGSVSVAARDFDLKGVATMVPDTAGGAGAFELPFVIQGSWQSPILMPDVESLIRRSGAAQPLLDAVRAPPARAVMDQIKSQPAADTAGAAPVSGPLASPRAPDAPTQQSN